MSFKSAYYAGPPKALVHAGPYLEGVTLDLSSAISLKTLQVQIMLDPILDAQCLQWFDWPVTLLTWCKGMTLLLAPSTPGKVSAMPCLSCAYRNLQYQAHHIDLARTCPAPYCVQGTWWGW